MSEAIVDYIMEMYHAALKPHCSVSTTIHDMVKSVAAHAITKAAECGLLGTFSKQKANIVTRASQDYYDYLRNKMEGTSARKPVVGYSSGKSV